MNKKHLEKLSHLAMQILATLEDVPPDEQADLLELAAAMASCEHRVECREHLQGIEAAMAAAASSIGMALPQDMFDSIQKAADGGNVLVSPPKMPKIFSAPIKGGAAPEWVQDEIKSKPKKPVKKK